MKKVYRILSVCVCLVMLSGCERTSVEDIYNMYSTEETGTEQSVEDKIIYDGLNIKYLLPDDVRIVDRSEKAELVNMHGKIGIEIIDVALGDSYYDMENYTDCEEIVYENIEKLQKKEGGFNHDFDDDGKVVSKYTNVDNGFIFIKMRLTNDSSETVEFSMGNIELYNMDEEHDYITDFRSIEDDLIDKQQTDGARRLYYEFKPNETADILRIYVYQKEQILSYKTISKDSYVNREAVDIGGPALKDLYMRMTCTGNTKVQSGECFIRLGIVDGGVVEDESNVKN